MLLYLTFAQRHGGFRDVMENYLAFYLDYAENIITPRQTAAGSSTITAIRMRMCGAHIAQPPAGGDAGAV